MRTFEKIVCMGEELKNEFDCPLLEKKERYIAIPTIDVVQSVSILHECTPTCTFSRKTHSTSIVERENIELNTLTFNHDSKNVYYSLNIYCIPSV